MAAAEATRIANVSLYEKSGPMAYDGWAGVGGDLTQGDPPLVVKERGSRYKLSTCGGDDAGKAVASALHAKAHERGWCACARPPAPVQPVRLEAPEQAVSPLHAAARRARVRARRRRAAHRRRRGPRRRRAGARPRRRRRRRPLVENRTRPRPATVTGARRRLGRQRAGLQPAAAAAAARDAGVVDHGFDDAARAALGHGPRDARATLRRANAVLERHEPLVGGVGRRRFDAAVVAVAGARARRRSI